MKQTQNLGLKLPEGSDWADVTALNENMEVLDAAVAGKADVGEDGKIPASQLPEMNYDPAGSAAAVQANLTAHTGNTSNPHGVTAEQIGAVPIGYYGDNIDNLVTAGFYRVQADQSLPAGIPYGNIIVARTPGSDTVLQIAVGYSNQFMLFRGGVVGSPNTWQPWSRVSIEGHTHDASQITSGILSAAQGGTGVGSIAALASLLAGQGLTKIQTLTYTGTGTFGQSAPNMLTFSFPPKFVIISNGEDTDGAWKSEAVLVVLNKLKSDGVSMAESGFSNLGVQIGWLKSTWNENTVSWYLHAAHYSDDYDEPPVDEGGPRFQANTQQTTYAACAFG